MDVRTESGVSQRELTVTSSHFLMKVAVEIVNCESVIQMMNAMVNLMDLLSDLITNEVYIHHMADNTAVAD